MMTAIPPVISPQALFPQVFRPNSSRMISEGFTQWLPEKESEEEMQNEEREDLLQRIRIQVASGA